MSRWISTDGVALRNLWSAVALLPSPRHRSPDTHRMAETAQTGSVRSMGSRFPAPNGPIIRKDTLMNTDLIERLRRGHGTGDLHLEAAEALTQAYARIARLEEDRARYQWLANAVLCCDYGDNDQGGAESADRIGWAIRLTRRNAIPFIFGQSIDAAIDAALKGEPK